MNFKFLRKICDDVKPHYGKMLVFSFSLGIILASCLALMLLFNLSLISIIIFFVLFLPLLLSFQLVCSRMLTNYEVNYDEIYKNYKAYYSPIFRGAYSLITSFFITILVLYCLMFFAVFIVIFNNKELCDLMINSSLDSESLTEYSNMLINDPTYGVCFSCISGISIIVYLALIFKKMCIPYFSFFFGLPTNIAKMFIKHVKKEEKSQEFKRNGRTIGLFYFVFTFLGYILTYIICINYCSMNLSLFIALLIAVVIGVLLLPFYITGCFINTYGNKNMVYEYMSTQIKEELNYMKQKNMSLPKEEKERLDKLLEELKSKKDDKDQKE